MNSRGVPELNVGSCADYSSKLRIIFLQLEKICVSVVSVYTLLGAMIKKMTLGSFPFRIEDNP